MMMMMMMRLADTCRTLTADGHRAGGVVVCTDSNETSSPALSLQRLEGSRHRRPHRSAPPAVVIRSRCNLFTIAVRNLAQRCSRPGGYGRFTPPRRAELRCVKLINTASENLVIR